MWAHNILSKSGGKLELETAQQLGQLSKSSRAEPAHDYFKELLMLQLHL